MGRVLILKTILNVPSEAQLYFQNPGSTSMEKIIDLHNDIMVFLVFIMFFISWMLLRIVWLFRIKNTKTIRFSFQHHTLLEQVWTIIPAVILVLIVTPSFSLLYAMDELRDPKLTVHVMGRQWYWSYEYPDKVYNNNVPAAQMETLQFDSYMLDEAELPEGGFRLLEVDNPLILPIRVSIRLLGTSRDVLHSWAIPALGQKFDCCPGRLVQSALFITKSGTYYGQCSELCGQNHSFMPIVVHAVSAGRFILLLKEALFKLAAEENR